MGTCQGKREAGKRRGSQPEADTVFAKWSFSVYSVAWFPVETLKPDNRNETGHGSKCALRLPKTKERSGF